VRKCNILRERCSAAPPKTPAAITEKISTDIAALLKLPDVGKRLA